MDTIVKNIETCGIQRDTQGRALNPFPQVPDLDSEATNFLIHTKRSIQAICSLPSLFLSIPSKDNNFDALGRTLTAVVGPDLPITKFVLTNASGVRYLIELRNYQEHPGAKRTVIENFTVMPDGAISVPRWYILGQTPQPLREEMQSTTEFLMQIAEATLIHLVMHTVDRRYPFIIQEIDDAQVNSKMPIKYRLSIDS